MELDIITVDHSRPTFVYAISESVLFIRAHVAIRSERLRLVSPLSSVSFRNDVDPRDGWY